MIRICPSKKISTNLFLYFKCQANSCLPSVMTDGTASKCKTSDGVCYCGAAENAACTSTSTTPKCMVTSTGVAPTAEADTANCQVMIFLMLPIMARIGKYV